MTYYAYYRLYDHDPAYHFRVDAGVFERWNPATRRWVRVRHKLARDFLSRAIENGDGAVIMTDEEGAALEEVER